MDKENKEKLDNLIVCLKSSDAYSIFRILGINPRDMKVEFSYYLYKKIGKMLDSIDGATKYFYSKIGKDFILDDSLIKSISCSSDFETILDLYHKIDSSNDRALIDWPLSGLARSSLYRSIPEDI